MALMAVCGGLDPGHLRDHTAGPRDSAICNRAVRPEFIYLCHFSSHGSRVGTQTCPENTAGRIHLLGKTPDFRFSDGICQRPAVSFVRCDPVYLADGSRGIADRHRAFCPGG